MYFQDAKNAEMAQTREKIGTIIHAYDKNI